MEYTELKEQLDKELESLEAISRKRNITENIINGQNRKIRLENGIEINKDTVLHELQREHDKLNDEFYRSLAKYKNTLDLYLLRIR